MSETIRGKCYMMCPLKESILREKEGLLHMFEIDQSTKYMKRPKADFSKIVKCFNRPAAGRNMLQSDELRPGPVLLMTINYLFTEIAIKKDCDWIIIYDFIFDRLRAIRQDLVIQQLDLNTSMCIYEHIIRFHTYAQQRLCERKIDQYDPKINMKHLQDCIEQLIMIYDEFEKCPSTINLDISENTESIVYGYNRVEMESLYILLRLGETIGLRRGLSLSEDLRNSTEVQLALKISFAWHFKNYVVTCRLIKLLPPLLKCIAFCNLSIIRREALLIMSSAYNITNSSFPIKKLEELLLYKNSEKLNKDCELFNLSIQNGNIKFKKNDFNKSVEMANPEKMFSDDELDKLLLLILI